MKVFRFRRVIIGAASSPVLLNATVPNHMEGCEELYPSTVAELMRSMYVDDMVCCANTESEAYTSYLEFKDMLARGGFNLHKFITNNVNLLNKIHERKRLPQVPVTECKVLGTQ
uniref:Reverse transcriptase domain-containing protein n=1 Tax=Amphimedon queenslandica TaxID=400682 RepID=A0A1X7TPP8_AMPQE